MAIPQNYDFAQFNDIEYHIAQRERYRLSLLDISRNMGIQDDALEDMMDDNFGNLPHALRQYGAAIELHSTIIEMFRYIRDLHGGNDTLGPFYDAIDASINLYHDDLSRVLIEMTENWMNTRRNPANV
jgi:hypothetical protein